MMIAPLFHRMDETESTEPDTASSVPEAPAPTESPTESPVVIPPEPATPQDSDDPDQLASRPDPVVEPPPKRATARHERVDRVEGAEDIEDPGFGAREPQRGLAAWVRALGIVSQSSGVATQIGLRLWSHGVGVAVFGTGRWGRTQRSLGTADAWVVGGGAGVGARWGAGSVEWRLDATVAVVWANLAASTERPTVRSTTLRSVAAEPTLAFGLVLPWTRVVLVPQLVLGMTPGAPRGSVTGDADVRLALPYGGVGVSVEPWLWRTRRH